MIKATKGPYIGETATYPLLGSFGGYSSTLPQGVESLVPLLVKSFFCAMNASPDEFLVRTPLEHLFEVLREVGGGGIRPLLFLGRKSSIFWLFLIQGRKSVSGSRLHGVCMGRSGTSANAGGALFSHFCYVGGSGDLGDPVVPTVLGVSGDVVTVYAD